MIIQVNYKVEVSVVPADYCHCVVMQPITVSYCNLGHSSLEEHCKEEIQWVNKALID